MIKFKSIYAGPAGVYQPGESAQLSDKEEKALIAGGYAEPDEPGAPKRNRNKRETAVDPATSGEGNGTEQAIET